MFSTQGFGTIFTLYHFCFFPPEATMVRNAAVTIRSVRILNCSYKRILGYILQKSTCKIPLRKKIDEK